MAEREKVSGFRLPEDTLEKLDELIALGIIRNRTDGIIHAINMFHSDNQYVQEREPFLYYFNRIISYEQVVKSLKDPNAVFPVRLLHGDTGHSIIDRISPTHVNIRMRFGHYGNTEVVIDICQNIIIDDDEDDENEIHD